MSLSSPLDRGRRALHRLETHGRRALAAIRELAPGRYPGAIVSVAVRGDQTVVDGWARRPRGTVVVFADGAPFGVAEIDPRSGLWRAEVGQRLAYDAELQASIISEHGLAERLDPFRYAPALPLRSLDLPLPGSTVAEPVLVVAGWTVDDPLAFIEITLADVPVRARPMATPRPDVAILISAPAAPFAGFEAVIDIADRVDGDVLPIIATAVDHGGRRILIGESEVTVDRTAMTETARSEVGTSAPTTAVDTIEARTDKAIVAFRRRRRNRPGVRLVTVTHDLGVGGGQLYLQELLLGLLAHDDVETTVVSPSDGALRAELEAAGAAVHVTGPYPTTSAGYASFQRELVAIAADLQATAVLANTVGAFVGVDAATRMGLPALWAIHESYALREFWYAAYGTNVVDPDVAARVPAALASAAAVVFEADATRALYCEHGDPRRFVTCPTASPFPPSTHFAPPRTAPPFGPRSGSQRTMSCSFASARSSPARHRQRSCTSSLGSPANIPMRASRSSAIVGTGTEPASAASPTGSTWATACGSSR